MGERITSCVAFSPPRPPISLALSSNACSITLRRIQEQGSTVLADNISSDVNGILLVFSATPEAGPSEAAGTGQTLNSGVDSTTQRTALNTRQQILYINLFIVYIYFFFYPRSKGKLCKIYFRLIKIVCISFPACWK